MIIILYRYYNDLTEMVLSLIKDESGKFQGKKLIASGNESLSFKDIDNLLKQTYVKADKKFQNRNKNFVNSMDKLQMFFHGNTHATNFKFMLDFVEKNNPKFHNYENASILLEQNLKSFGEYYNEKASKINHSVPFIDDEYAEDFSYPSLQNYYKISLD
jgi:hypothetical protein